MRPLLLFRVALCAVTALCTTACLTTERPAVVDSAAFMTPANGTWQDGDEHITWTSAARDSLLEIREAFTFGTDGVGERTLRYRPDGRLVQWRETRTQTAQAGDRSPSTMRVTLAIDFGADSAARATKQVDGVDTPVRPYEIANARRHGAALLAAVSQHPLGSPR